MTDRSEGPAPIRLGYVGCGFMAQRVHLPNFSSLPGCRLVAVAEMRPQLGRSIADRYGVRLYRSHLELAADPEVEAVGVSAGFSQQAEVATDLLRRGKHVFMEKPMAVSVAQAERMLEAARAGGARLMVGYMKRYDPGNVLARETIARWRADGSHGDVVFARGHGFQGDWLSRLDRSQTLSTGEAPPADDSRPHLPAWLPPAEAPRYLGYLQQYTHNVNLLRYLLGTGDEARVRVVDLDPDGATGIVVLDLGGTRAVLESGSIRFHDWEEHTQVYFQRGWVQVWSPPLMARETQARVEIYEAESPSAYHHPEPGPLTAWAYREEAASFIRCLRTGEPFRSSGEDTLTDVRLFEEIYQRYLGREA